MYEITVNAKNHRKCKKSRLSLMNATGEGPLQTLLDFLTPAATAAAAQKRENPFPQFLTISGYTFPAYFLFFYTFLVDTYSHKISFFVVYFFHDPSCSTFPFQVFSLFLSFARFSEVVAHILSSPHFFFIMNERIWFFVIVFSHS